MVREIQDKGKLTLHLLLLTRKSVMGFCHQPARWAGNMNTQVWDGINQELSDLKVISQVFRKSREFKLIP